MGLLSMGDGSYLSWWYLVVALSWSYSIPDTGIGTGMWCEAQAMVV